MSFTPKVDVKFKLRATVDGTFDSSENGRFFLAWCDDLPPLAGKTDSSFDDRKTTIKTCKYWKNLTTTIKSNKAEVEVESTADPKDWNSRTAIEIYACIRAEYKFVEEGYRKVQSRTGTNGIDHLFVKPNARALVVESKTDSDLALVARLVKDRDPNAVISKLGKGVQVRTTKGGVIFATQMSQQWVGRCLNKLRKKLKKSGNAADKAAVNQVRADMRARKPPHRIVNIYGGLNWDASGAYDELVAKAIDQWDELSHQKRTAKLAKWKKSGKMISGESPVVQSLQAGTGLRELLWVHDEWKKANPDRGRFYLLPGKYRLQAQPAEFVGVKEDAQTVEFADEKFRDNEFFYIDKWSAPAQEDLETETVDLS